MARWLAAFTFVKGRCSQPATVKAVVVLAILGYVTVYFLSRPLGMRQTTRVNSQNSVLTELELPESLPLVYSNKGIRTFNSTVRFSVDRQSLLQLGIPPKMFLELTKENVQNIIFVTGASDNHFWEVLDVVSGVQHYFPGHQMIFVDFGLSEQKAAIVQTWCHVTYHKFDFSQYPRHVSNMWYYAWKILTIQRFLHEFPERGVLWLDASVRFDHGDLSVPFSMALANGGMVHLSAPALSIFSVTHPRLYEYFPTDIEKTKSMDMVQAGALLVYNTRQIYEGVLYWAYLCALEKDCIAPSDMLQCSFMRRNWHKEWVGCHRYDQSVWNVLESNFHNFNSSIYDSHKKKPVISIVRKATTNHELHFCLSGGAKIQVSQTFHRIRKDLDTNGLNTLYTELKQRSKL